MEANKGYMIPEEKEMSEQAIFDRYKRCKDKLSISEIAAISYIDTKELEKIILKFED